MSIYRIFPSKDTFITNDIRRAVRMTASNLGFSEEISVFKRPGVSGVIGAAGSSSLGRILMQFDFSAYNALTASNALPVSGSSYLLRLAHKTSNDTLPYSYDLIVRPISCSWDEGRGHDVDDLADSGFANWMRPTQTSYWVTPGGDMLASPTASMHFDTGYEDIELDITRMVNAWLTGGLANNGLCIALTGNLESDSNYDNYYIKKFYSRQTGYLDRRPCLEVSVPDHRLDDRGNMSWGRTGSLYLYNVVGDQYADLPSGQVVVSIADASGILTYATASHVGTGIYSASFALTSGSYSGSIFYDRWRLDSVALMTSSFTFQREGAVGTTNQSVLTARVKNLQVEYSGDEVVKFDVLFRRKGIVLPVLSTASLGTPPYIVERGYWALENDSTRERVINFGTGSDETRLSYDENGNSFILFMSNLSPGEVYKILFMVDEYGRKKVIDPDARFKVI